MKNLTFEMISKAKAAKSAEELLALAKENGVEMTAEEAKKYFEQLNANGEVADEELEFVAGGRCGSDEKDAKDVKDENTLSGGDRVKMPPCPACHNTTGYVAMPTAMIGSLEIKCEKCKRVVGTTADASKFTKI